MDSLENFQPSMAAPEWTPVSLKKLDWQYQFQRYKTFFAVQDPLFHHDDGCYCKKHPCAHLPEERRTQPKALCNHPNTLQQFTTPFDIALAVADDIASVVAPGQKFLDLGAGNGALSAALLLRGFAGRSVEIDAKSQAGKLKEIEIEMPFGTVIPYEPFRGCVNNLDDMNVDFVVMNPPYEDKNLYNFVNAAQKQSNVIFALLPTAKLPESGKFDFIQKLADEFDLMLYPLSTYAFPLHNTRRWHTEDVTHLSVTLVAMLKRTVVKTTESLVDTSTLFGVEEIVRTLLHDAEPSTDTYVPTDDEVINQLYAQVNDNYIPVFIPMVGSPASHALLRSIRARQQLGDNSGKDVVWGTMDYPRLGVTSVETNGIGSYRISYGTRGFQKVCEIETSSGFMPLLCFMDRIHEDFKQGGLLFVNRKIGNMNKKLGVEFQFTKFDVDLWKEVHAEQISNIAELPFDPYKVNTVEFEKVEAVTKCLRQCTCEPKQKVLKYRK